MANDLISYKGKDIYLNTDNAAAPVMTRYNSGQVYLNANFSETFYNCQKLVFNLDSSGFNFSRVKNMYYSFRNCQNIYGNIPEIPKATNMSSAFLKCYNITGEPAITPYATNMVQAYSYSNLIHGNAYIGNNTIFAARAYAGCVNLNGHPMCGENTVNMYGTYAVCYALTGSPVCGNNVVDLSYAYSDCYNITGNPVCGTNVFNMFQAYSGCNNLIGPAVCGNNVTNMVGTYCNCNSLNGIPACGPNVTNMRSAYYGCSMLTAPYACGPNVKDMSYAYGNAIADKNISMNCENVTNMYKAFERDFGVYGNIYLNYKGNETVNAEYLFGEESNTSTYRYINAGGVITYYSLNIHTPIESPWFNYFLNCPKIDSDTYTWNQIDEYTYKMFVPTNPMAKNIYLCGYEEDYEGIILDRLYLDSTLQSLTFDKIIKESLSADVEDETAVLNNIHNHYDEEEEVLEIRNRENFIEYNSSAEEMSFIEETE